MLCAGIVGDRSLIAISRLKAVAAALLVDWQVWAQVRDDVSGYMSIELI